MKTFFLIVAVFLLIVVAAAVIFVVTFNPNHYRLMIAEQLSQAAGRPVNIDSISLAYRKGVALELAGLKVGKSAGASAEPFRLKTGRVFLVVDVAPLFKKEIRVKECLIESPEIEIQNAPSASSEKPSSPTVSTAVPPASKRASAASGFEIDRLIVSDGKINIENKTAGSAPSFSVENINLQLANISLHSPIKFSGSAVFTLGEKRHVLFDGLFSYADASVEFKIKLDRDIAATGTVKNIFGVPLSRLAVTVQNLDVATYLSQEQKAREYFSGLLQASMNLEMSGKEIESIKQTLSGAGQIRISDGALKNKNLLRENLQRLTQIPGIGELFQFDLGARFNALLQSPDTSFGTLDANLQIANSQVTIQKFVMVHEDYSISLSGAYQMSGAINSGGTLVIGKPLSDAIIKKVKELVYISDPEGRISIPFVYTGAFPGAIPQPQVGNIAVQAVSNAGMEFLQKGLESYMKRKNKNQPAQAPSE